ncbi:MAG TPA: hypothetical protein VF665_21470 [Longimicrobium sp.]|jgi:hypothetical protein|uniref:hypothetical protein n=1 Tax=Longimicrobium sp. TaxID=2029185 RepID=UPI002ED9A9FE
MSNPSAIAQGSFNGPPLDVVVTVDGAPAAVVFSLVLVDPVTNQNLRFGPADPMDSALNYRYRVPGPTWWQNNKLVFCQVDGEPGAWAQNTAHLRAFQGDEELRDAAWDTISGDDPDAVPLTLTFQLQ